MTHRSRPRVGVLIPAYKAEVTINHALATLAQNAEPHDVWILDDGSPLPVEKVVPPAPNLTILRLEKNVGISEGPNIALRKMLDAGYEYIARFDADDECLPGRLAAQRAFLDAHPDVGLVGGWAEVVMPDGAPVFELRHPLEHKAILRKSFYNSAFIHPSLMFRASALRKLGPYDENYPVGEDYEITRRFARSVKVANLPRIVIRYTLSPGGVSLSKRHLVLRARLRIQWRYRNWLSVHFYLGALKTLALWAAPVSILTIIKQALGRSG